MIETPINVHPSNGEVIDHNSNTGDNEFSFKFKGDRVSFITGEMYDAVLDNKRFTWKCGHNVDDSYLLAGSSTYNNETVRTHPSGFDDSDYGKEFKYRYSIYQQFPNLYTDINGALKRSTLKTDSGGHYYGGFIADKNKTDETIKGIYYIFKVVKSEQLKQYIGTTGGSSTQKSIYKITIDMPKQLFDYIDMRYSKTDVTSSSNYYGANSVYTPKTFVFNYPKQKNDDGTYSPTDAYYDDSDITSTHKTILGYSKTKQCLYTDVALTADTTWAIQVRLYSPLFDIYYGRSYFRYDTMHRSAIDSNNPSPFAKYPNRIYLPNTITNFKPPIYDDSGNLIGGMFLKIGYESRLIINVDYDKSTNTNGAYRNYIELDSPLQDDILNSFISIYGEGGNIPFQIYTNYIQTGWYNFKDRHSVELTTNYFKGRYGLVCKGDYSQDEGESLKCYDFSVSDYSYLKSKDFLEIPSNNYYSPIDDKYGILHLDNLPIQGYKSPRDFTKIIGNVQLYKTNDISSSSGTLNIYGYKKGMLYIAYGAGEIDKDNNTLREQFNYYKYDINAVEITPIISTPQIYSYDIQQELILPIVDRTYRLDFNANTQDNQTALKSENIDFPSEDVTTTIAPYYDYYTYDNYGNIINTDITHDLCITPVVDNKNKVITLTGRNINKNNINVFRVDKENNYYYIGRIGAKSVNLTDYTIGNKSEVSYYFESGNINEYIQYQRNVLNNNSSYVSSKPLSVSTDWNGWCISSLTYIMTVANKKMYDIGDTWHFLSNINSDSITTNFNPQIHQNTSYYSQTSRNDNKYESGTFTADLLTIDCPTMEIIDDIQRVNAWKKFLLENDTFLLKSHKGDVWIVGVSANPTRSYENNLYNTTTVSYQWTEIEDVNDIIVKNESDAI